MDDVKIPEKDGELDKLVKEKEEYLNGWKRAKADLINYQKDETKRAQEFVKIANASIIIDLIPVLDSFDLALSIAQSGGSADLTTGKGVVMIKSQLEEILKRYGVEKMDSGIGKPLDTRLQEAVGEVESEHPPGTVAEEVGRGYSLNGKVLRPAKVKIAKSV
ncbi:MAG: nucleotide exchange factor GrpE [Patescibacteria group bacterium]